MRIPPFLFAGAAFVVDPLTRMNDGNVEIVEKKGKLRFKVRSLLAFNDPRDIEVHTEPYKNGCRLAVITKKIEKLDRFGNKVFSEDKEVFTLPKGVDYTSK